MLKNFLLTISALAFIGLWQAADAQTYLSEDFTNGIPGTWTIIDGDGNTPHPDWPAISYSTDCGAVYPLVQGWEGYCGFAMSISWYQPAGQSDDWLITAPITIPANAPNAYLKYKIGAVATQRQRNFNDDYAVRIGTTTTPADHIPNLLNSNVNTPTLNGADGEELAIDLSQWIGQTVYVSFQNFANDEYALLLDYVEVLTLPDNDVRGDLLTLDLYEVAPVSMSGDFTNQGASAVTSVEVKYQIDGGNVETATVSGLNIAPFQTANIAFPTPYQGVGLTNNIRYWVSQVNGSADASPADNELTTNRITIAPTADKRKVLMETFTSSTCGPCLPGNIALEGLLSQLDVSNPGDVVSIKFQQNFPGDGDPYCTDETQNRRNFYGINSIPQSAMDGYFEVDPRSVTLQDFQDHIATDGFGKFSGTANIDFSLNEVFLNGSFTANVDHLGTEILQIAIVERRTENNIGNNRETEFFDVVKKMVPNDNGTFVGNMKAGDVFNLNQAFTFRGNYRLPRNAGDRINNNFEHSVEDFSNLYVVAWVENQAEKYVLNAGTFDAWAVGIDEEINNFGSLSVSPNPASDFANINLDLTEAASVKLEVVNVEGKVVLTKDAGTLATGNNSIELNVSDLPAGTYHVTALMEQGMITRPLMIVR